MNSIVKVALVGFGAVLIWLWDKEPKIVAVVASAKKENKPTEEEVRKVMRELGKKSGRARSQKL